MKHRSHLATLALLVLAATMASACTAKSMAHIQQCSWQITSTRPASATDTALVDRIPLLAEPEDLNFPPGPGSLRLLRLRTAPRKYGIFLYDTLSKDSTLLTKSGSLPRFSPDGRYISYTTWKSTDEPWNLMILDRETGSTIQPALGGCVTSYRKWSPDSRWLAVQSTICKTPKTRLMLVSLPEGKTYAVDTLAVFGEYEFSWSPGSNALAVVRPEAVNRHTEATTVADLWIISVPGATRCRLSLTPTVVESEPEWVTDRSLLVSHTSDAEEGRRFLVQLSGGGP